MIFHDTEFPFQSLGFREDADHVPSISYSHVADSELTPCVVIKSATPIIVTEDTTISASSSGHSHRDPNDTQLSDNAAPVTSQDSELSVQTPTVVTRRSNRSAKPPIWHTDYVLTKKNTSAGSCSYSISDVVDYQSISPTYKSFVNKFSQEREPTT